MIAQSPIAGDSRILREATALAAAGHVLHVIGRDVPEGFEVGPGITVESVSRSAGLRTGNGGLAVGHGRSGPKVLGAADGRWLLLPEHRNRDREAMARRGGASSGRRGPFDVVHAHDFNTLELAAEYAEKWSAKLVYDSHELWFDRALPGRPTPLWRARGRRFEVSRLLRRPGSSSLCPMGSRIGCVPGDCRTSASYATRSRSRTRCHRRWIGRRVCCTPVASVPAGICRPWSRPRVSWRRSARC